jgi:hypothetical protein
LNPVLAERNTILLRDGADGGAWARGTTPQKEVEQLRELCADFPMKLQQNAALRAKVHNLETLVATHNALLCELTSNPPRGHSVHGGAITARRMAPAGAPACVRARCPPSGFPRRRHARLVRDVVDEGRPRIRLLGLGAHAWEHGRDR